MKSFALTFFTGAVFQNALATGGYNPEVTNNYGEQPYEHFDYTAGYINDSPKFLNDEEFEFNSIAEQYEELLSLYDEALAHEKLLDEREAQIMQIHEEVPTHEELVEEAYNDLA